MKKVEYCSLGHVSLDLILSQIQTGGSCVYGAVLASHLSMTSEIVTAGSESYPYKNFPEIIWHRQHSTATTTYQHEYRNNQRISCLTEKSDSIRTELIPENCKKADIVMIAPIVDEVTPELINVFSTEWIGLTPQGWFRRFDDHGKMTWGPSLFGSLPKKIKLIVVSQEDLVSDPKAWDWIQKFSEVAVCTMGKQGYLLSYNGKEKKYSPLKVMDEKNPTGCGDIFSTSTLILLSKGMDPVKACELAGQAAGLAATKENLRDSVRIAGDFLSSKF